jgi:hypothetical protein
VLWGREKQDFSRYSLIPCSDSLQWSPDSDQSLLFHTHSLTHSLMELSPSWDPANCAATQEIPSVLWNPKVHYRVHKSPPLVPTQNQINPIRTIPPYLSKIHLNIVHPSTSWSSQWSLPLWISHQYPICIPLLPHSYYKPCPSHPPWLEFYSTRKKEVHVVVLRHSYCAHSKSTLAWKYVHYDGQKYCYVLRVCVTYKTGFVFELYIYIPIKLRGF